MGQFIYFIPGQTNDTGNVVADAGLADRVGDNRCASGGQGPDGAAGVFVSPNSTTAFYKPDEQTWSGTFGDAGYWIGFARDDRPGPADLVRPRQMRGALVELLDGNEWLIPAAVHAPCSLTQKNGQVVQTPLELSQRLWAIITDIGPQFLKPESEGLLFVDCLPVVAELLAVNYRVSPDPEQEVSALELISTDNVNAVLLALMDLSPEAEKKTE